MARYYENVHSIFENKPMRIILFLTMAVAFAFGYLDQIIHFNFERLHIFLFNLSSGGFIILYLAENRKKPSFLVYLFYMLSLVFAFLAFLELYLAAMMLAIVLGSIAEIIRLRNFPFFPKDFFRSHVPISRKFQQASLLCLVLGLFLSSVVILNNQYYHWFYFPKLTLNVFFLGFSFPVSLITLSVIFNFIKSDRSPSTEIIEHYSFWSINLGVIVFFIFIIFEIFPAEFAAAFTLFVSVIIVFFFFFRFGIDQQQKKFLISGIFFLLGTAITGLLYIILKMVGNYDKFWGNLILWLHTYLSLYGWNLSGLMIILRWNHFPIHVNTKSAILFHWIIISIFAPLGKKSLFFAGVAILTYIAFLLIFFTEKTTKISQTESETIIFE